MKPNSTYSKKFATWQIDSIGVIAFIGLTSITYFIGILPLKKQYQQVNQHQTQLAEINQLNDKLTKSRIQLSDQLKQFHQALDRGTFSPKPINHLNKQLAMLTELATNSGLSLHEIQPGKPISTTHYQTVPILMSGIGTYQTYTAFMNKIHHDLPDIRVAALNLAATQNSAKPEAQFKMTLAWHAKPVTTSKNN